MAAIKVSRKQRFYEEPAFDPDTGEPILYARIGDSSSQIRRTTGVPNARPLAFKGFGEVEVAHDGELYFIVKPPAKATYAQSVEIRPGDPDYAHAMAILAGPANIVEAMMHPDES